MFCTYLDKGAHVGKVRVHSTTVWKILVHPLHQFSEAAERHNLWKHTHTNTPLTTFSNTSVVYAFLCTSANLAETEIH